MNAVTVETPSRTTTENLPQEAVEFYQTNGFVRVRGIISPEEAAEFGRAALDTSDRVSNHAQGYGGKIFDQHVNVWTQDEVMMRLTLHPNVGQVAEKLAGVPLRLWHDHILIKRPGKSIATEFHQDQPYWPHANSLQPISAWIALCDVPVEKGCMTFIPGSHKRTDLPPQNLGDHRSLFSICPDLEWETRVTLPLRAGDCTFHHGRCAHMATPNLTDDPRIAHVIIYIDAATTYRPARHVVTDPLNLQEGALIEGDLFPRVADLL
jgi:ectoine hydroxylase-related dioxygenase (phytanoyl-CoA dioxygenase family)